MENKVLQRPLGNMSLPRNGFPRGFEIKFNQSSGQIIPVFSQPCFGGTKIRLNRKELLRCSTVNTAAMPTVDHHIDFYFVPFRQLLTVYGMMRANVKDTFSSNWSDDFTSANLPPMRGSVIQSLLEDLDNNSKKDMMGYSKLAGTVRLLDLLGYGFNCQRLTSDCLHLSDVYDATYLGDLSPLRACAYQKVWYDHYRQTNYVRNNVHAYNLDDNYDSAGSLSPAVIPLETLEDMLELHYAPLRKDYFTNIYPSLNYVGVNQGDISNFKIPSNIQGFGTSASGPYAFYPPENDSKTIQNVPSVFQPLNQSYNISALNVQQIRAMFALDKLTRLAAYAPKHVADQFEARFGFRPLAEDMNESKFIGAFRTDMQIAEVLSTAETDHASIGALGGRGYAVADREKDSIDYLCPEDGIVLGVSYVLPRISYDSLGIDKFNTALSPAQFFEPTMQDLGLVPITRKELAVELTSDLQDIDELNNEILGYQPNYSEYKIGIDRNHGLFNVNMPLSIFSTHTKSNFIADKQVSQGLAPWFFYCSPKDLDPIFADEFDGSELTDQFFGLIRFDFDVVQNMSVHGQPSI